MAIHKIIAYHGTSTEFEKFEKPAVNAMADRSAVGFWFTSSEEDAITYGSIVVQAELTMYHPKRITRRELDFLAVSLPVKEIWEKFRAFGHDSLIVEAIQPDRAMEEPGMPEQYVVFKAEQIKILNTRALARKVSP